MVAAFHKDAPPPFNTPDTVLTLSHVGLQNKTTLLLTVLIGLVGSVTSQDVGCERRGCEDNLKCILG